MKNGRIWLLGTALLAVIAIILYAHGYSMAKDDCRTLMGFASSQSKIATMNFISKAGYEAGLREFRQDVAEGNISLSSDFGSEFFGPGFNEGLTEGFRRGIQGEYEGEYEREEETRPRAEREAVLQAAVHKLSGDMVAVPGKGYSICKYEVTQALWEAVMGNNPSSFKGDNHPVEGVSWDDCQEFLKKLNALPEVRTSGVVYRLPTADEWEYACRAGSTGKYGLLADGTEGTLDEMGWYDDNSGDKTHPVGRKKPNAFGLYDMHGNVREWTSTEKFFEMPDLLQEWTSSADAPCWANCGGSWYCIASSCESGNRNWSFPVIRNFNFGFRLACDRVGQPVTDAVSASKPVAGESEPGNAQAQSHLSSEDVKAANYYFDAADQGDLEALSRIRQAEKAEKIARENAETLKKMTTDAMEDLKELQKAFDSIDDF